MNGWLLAIAGATVLAVLLTPKTALGYVQGKAVQLELTSIGGGFYLRSDAAAAFKAMAASARGDGVTFQVNSAFRSMESQQELHARYLAGTGSLAATPGYSNHQGGVAVDIDAMDASGQLNAAFRWLTDNAARFSFRRTVPSEVWHWEYRA